VKGKTLIFSKKLKVKKNLCAAYIFLEVAALRAATSKNKNGQPHQGPSTTRRDEN